MSGLLSEHQGACHCGAITFTVQAPSEELEIDDCNCSICYKKGFLHLIVPKSRFQQVKGQDHLNLYTFGTGTAKHYFCKTCGISPFYIPRSNPDGYDVNFRCLDHSSIKSYKIIPFDGKDNWEAGATTVAHKSVEN
ncbi:hypothetical protein PROFUN_12618 [Planoprotostelium fungivorum]|uniref:CENP-V/GFA domain-containing protein n=1 Tax=Planoprotostelium fungivorum TaxID=1890364 RepID=A0A2P6N720_9EUKA|nr:hypothetical protein PROFUN_12618 [Planoprotostelium fungivorum]